MACAAGVFLYKLAVGNDRFLALALLKEAES